MKKVVTLFFFICFTLPLFSREVEVTVSDKDLQTPLEGVTLSWPGAEPVKTDSTGHIVFKVPDTLGRFRLTATLIGYNNKKLWMEPSQTSIQIFLALAGEVEGDELVVEKDKPQKTDAKAGVSTVATGDQIQSTGSLGIVEDVMSTIKTLPGVGFTGDFNAMPSIEGGSPSETKSVLDGASVLYPYQWGGAVSIFDPAMVETAKLSAGTISARYGDVISGLIEVNSKVPARDTPEFDLDVSTSAFDAFAQVPVGKDAGWLVGGKATYLGLLFPFLGAATSAFTQAPSIENGYTRFYWKPSTNFEWDVNAFYGVDGVGESSNYTDDGLTTSGGFTYTNAIAFGSTRVSDLADLDDLWTASFGFNRWDTSDSGSSTTNGTSKVTGSVVDNMTNTFASDTVQTSYQLSTSLDHQLDSVNLISLGVSTQLLKTDGSSNTSFWTDSNISTGKLQLVEQTASIAVSGNEVLTSGIYGIWEFGHEEDLFSGELGLRVDHSFLFNNDMQLNTYPVANPRARLVYTPLVNQGWLSRLSLTAGSGLYSQMTNDTNLFSKNDNLANFSVGPDRAWSNSLAVELLTDDGWSLSLEGYFKTYFNRLFILNDESSSSTCYVVHTDGTGLSLGANLLVQKRLSRYWDGWLSYSFNDTRLHNPAQPGYSSETTVEGDPLGQDYYPSYQQFHVVHLVSDWKPVDGFSLMVDASLATGTPLDAEGPVQSYVSQFHGNPVTRYTQSWTYSDTLRSGTAYPVDMKLSWFGYYPHSSVRWETYFAVEDLFALWYRPKGGTSLNPWTGQTSSTTANYSLGIPLPSFGYKLSF